MLVCNNYIAGSTVTDAQHWLIQRLDAESVLVEKVSEILEFINPEKLMLAGSSRRDSSGGAFECNCKAIRALAVFVEGSWG